MTSDLLTGKATLAFAMPLGLWLIAAAAAAAMVLVVAGVRRAPWATVLRCGALLLLLLNLAGLSIETREAAQDLCLVVSEDLSASVAAGSERLTAKLLQELLARGWPLGAKCARTSPYGL